MWTVIDKNNENSKYNTKRKEWVYMHKNIAK